MKKLMMLTALALVVSAPVAMAGHGDGGGKHHKGGGKMMEKMFEHNDTNKDGVISKAEFLASAEERFSKMDADGNGEITKEEAKAHHQEMRKKWQERKGKAMEKRDSSPE